ncbi:MAG: Type II secretion system protein [Candidatus Peregrinibacteria bacterium GW2011_GWA2_47_7]|nr:MAG: Type II secretion system protein [Candidatus Peregrinibacteria bacterium GW2011_GWA2_47_7]
MKKAQDFLVDTTLGEKSYELQKPEEEKIVLSIEEGAVPVSLLKDTAKTKAVRAGKSLFAQINEFLKSLGSPTPKDIATFFRLLSIMINAGIPLIKSLDTIGDQTANRKLKLAIFEIARFIEKGGTLSASMINYPGIFTDGHIGMIRAGEVSGQLNNILKQLAVEVEKVASIKRKVKGAMMYPFFIVLVLIAVISGMMIFVVPKIADIFLQSGKELPLLTQIVISISNFMQQQWYILLGGIALLYPIYILIRRSQQGNYAVDWTLLHIPIFGDLLQKSILARFSRSLSSLLTSGVPIVQGLIINAKGLSNAVYQKRVELASEDIARGIPLGESLRDAPEFPNMMVQMISVGEQTAQLDTIAIKIAEYYEDEVDVAVNSLSKVLEPLILVVVGVVVGGIIGAIMIPIIQLSQISSSL